MGRKGQDREGDFSKGMACEKTPHETEVKGNNEKARQGPEHAGSVGCGKDFEFYPKEKRSDRVSSPFFKDSSACHKVNGLLVGKSGVRDISEEAVLVTDSPPLSSKSTLFCLSPEIGSGPSKYFFPCQLLLKHCQ